MKEKIITIILTLVLLALVYTKIDLNTLILSITSINPIYIILFIVFVSVSLLIKTMQWNYLIKPFKRIKLIRLYPFLILSNIYGKLTPGNLGEFYRGELLYKNYNIPRSKAYSTVLIDKMISLLASFLLIFISLIFIKELFNDQTINSILLIFGIFLIAVITFFILIFNERMKKIVLKLIPKKFKNYIKSKFNNVKTAIKIINKNKKDIINSLFFSIIFWLFNTFNQWFLLKGLGYQINFLFLISAALITMLITMIPITVSGFGTRELSLIFFLNQIGIPSEVSVSFSLIKYFLNIITILIINFFINKKRLKL